MSLVIVGSVAFDTIETPRERKEKIIGGSCTFGSLAASYFTRPGIVAVVGEDFPDRTIAYFRKRRIDLKGLKVVPGGKTFHWQGRYGDDPNERETIRTDLNVFADFRPDIPPSYRKADILLLANIDPDLQEIVLAQTRKPRLTAMDTIGLWINTKREALLDVLRKVDIYFANEEEIRMLTGERNVVTGARRILELGPRLVVAKRGEHGVLVLGKDLVFGMMAFPSERVVDPTGAGDSFAGGFLGYLDRAGRVGARELRRAAAYGTVLASFTIEDFGIDRYLSLKPGQIEERFKTLKAWTSY